MLLRNLVTGEIFEVLIMDNSTTSTTSITIQQVITEIEKYVGKGNKLTFEGTLSNGMITFVPPIGSYDIKEGYDYEIELNLPDTSEIRSYDDGIAMVIANGGMTYRFWTITYYPAMWGHLKELADWNATTGYTWRFKARYHVTADNQDLFYIFPNVNNIPIATQWEIGGVMSDGETILIDSDGIISRAPNEWTLINETVMPEWSRIDANNQYELTLDYQLPDDGKDYEVMFDLRGEHQGSLYDIIKLYCFSDYTVNHGSFSDEVICLINSQQLNDSTWANKQPYQAHCVIPISTGRTITFQNKSSKNAYVEVRIIGYRKL